MLPSQVVERLDIVEQVDIRYGPRTVADVMHPLILQTVEEALGRGVIPAIAFAAHRADQHVLLQPRLKAWPACWLPRVGVMDQARRRFLAEPDHRQRMLRVSGRLEAPLIAIAHQPFDALLAGRESPDVQLAHHAGGDSQVPLSSAWIV